MKKTAGTPTTRKNVATIANAFNPLAYSLWPDFYMPAALSDRDGALATGDIDLDKALWLTMTSSVAGAGAGALARYLTKAPDQKVIEEIFTDPSGKLRKAVKAGALPKQAGFMGTVLGTAGPVAGMGLGAYGGYQLMDKLMDRQRKQQLKAQLVDLYKKLDEIHYQKLLAARPEELGKKEEEALPKQAGIMDTVKGWFEPSKGSGILNSTASLAALLLAMGAGGGAVASYYTAKDANPFRVRLKKLKLMLNNMNSEDRQEMPVNIKQTHLLSHILKQKAQGKPASTEGEVRPLDMPKLEGVSLADKLRTEDLKQRSKDTAVDNTDPTMSII